MRKLILIAIICLIAFPALAYRWDATVDAVDDVVEIARVKRAAYSPQQLWTAVANVFGTFNGCTLHYLVSTDDGVNKVPYKNESGTAETSTSGDNFRFTWGWPSRDTSAIFYASASGCISAPSITIDVDDQG